MRKSQKKAFKETTPTYWQRKEPRLRNPIYPIRGEKEKKKRLCSKEKVKTTARNKIYDKQTTPRMIQNRQPTQNNERTLIAHGTPRKEDQQ